MDQAPSGSTSEVLKKYIHNQFMANSQVTLAHFQALTGKNYVMQPDLWEFACTNREAVLSLIHAEMDQPEYASEFGLTAEFLRHIKYFIYANNQFIQLSSAQHRQLSGLYLEYLSRQYRIISSEKSPYRMEQQIRGEVGEHLQRLSAFLARLDATGSLSGQNLSPYSVTCGEYSPTLQLQLLGLRLEDLMEPVLDLGCGQQAGLVTYLREKGIQAFGLDRQAPETAYTLRGSWLDFSFAASPTWGTIISQMAFSNHFLFHHLSPNGNPLPYAQKYVEILNSLRPRGSFYYTPGLPFMESLLSPATFHVKRRDLSAILPQAGPSSDLYQKQLGVPVLYATRITRLTAG